MDDVPEKVELALKFHNQASKRQASKRPRCSTAPRLTMGQARLTALRLMLGCYR